jgi:hypothetical protein
VVEAGFDPAGITEADSMITTYPRLSDYSSCETLDAFRRRRLFSFEKGG